MRREIAARLIAEVLPGFEVLQRPDHPLLLDGPDFLAGRTGELVAVLVARAAERGTANRLSARYALARLAYPPNTRWLLFVDADVPWTRGAISNFNETIEVREGSAHSLGEREIDAPRAEVLDNVWERAALLEGISADATGTHSRRPVGEPSERIQPATLLDESRHDWTQSIRPSEVKLRWRPKGLALLEGGLVGVSQADHLSESVQPYVRWLTQRSLVLDNGAPYLVDDHVGILAAWADLPRDPMKPARAAALAGWALVPPTPGRLNAAVRRLSEAPLRWRE